jgi:hypothetical protein
MADLISAKCANSASMWTVRNVGGKVQEGVGRAGNELSGRFPFIAMAVGKVPVRSCLIDGEAIVCDENGLAVFELIRRHGALASAVHCAFDLLELDGRDLRREPQTLALQAPQGAANEHRPQ